MSIRRCLVLLWQNIQLKLVVALLAANLSSCGDAPAPSQQALQSNTVNVDGLVVVQAVQSPLGNRRQWNGVVEAVHQAMLSAQTSGRVSALLVDVNDTVKAGDVLARFSNVEQLSAQIRAQAGLNAALAQSIEAEAEYKRAREIYAERVIAKAQLEQSLARRDAARAQVASARAQLREAGQELDYTIVRAPFTGVVGQRHVQVGEAVAPGQAIFSVHAPEQLRVRVSLPQSEAALLNASSPATVVVNSGEEITVVDLVIFPDADAQAHTVTVRLNLPANISGLKPGATVNVLLLTPGKQALLIPNSAVLRRSELTSVYVIADKTIRLRQIRLGHGVGDQVEVLSGLKLGENIAADPIAAGLRLSDMSSSKMSSGK
jgi:RND family efflux transporter MFP subunit